MKEHKVNKLNNFIGAWTPDDTTLCDELIEYHKNTPDKGPGRRNKSVDPTLKDSIDCSILDPELLKKYIIDYLQPVAEKYMEKYPYCNNYAPWRVDEYPNIQHYSPGGGYHAWHCERSQAEHRVAVRHLVYMTYLNDVTDAGETDFFHQKIKIKPQKGLTVIWPTDWTFTHRGIVSPSQEKYIVTGWYSFINP